MAAVTLVEMTDAEFARRREPMIEEFARSLAGAGRMPLAQARATAAEETAKLLPEGPRTPGQLVRTARAGEAEIGWIWVSLPGHAVSGMAWIDDIVVDEQHRRQGYGEAMITAVEGQLSALGVDRLGLNVFGDNDVARRLYERLGFEVTQQHRKRSSAGLSAPDGPAVTLRPLAEADFERRMASFVAATRADYPSLTAAQAHERAWKPLPDGLTTEDVAVRAIVAGDTEAGWIFFTHRHWNTPELGWIYRLDIDQPFRGRGHGAASVAAAAADIAGHGVTSFGAAVPGASVTARRLADRLGFAVTAQQMEKNLPVAGR